MEDQPTDSHPSTTSSNASGISSPKEGRMQKTLVLHCISSIDTLLNECAKELYAIVLSQIVSLDTDIGPLVPEHGSGDLRFLNEIVANLQTKFVETNLGSDADALYCILPVLKNHVKKKMDIATVLPLMVEQADKAIPNSNQRLWAIMMRYLCNLCERELSNCTHDKRARALAFYKTALISLGELYRSAFCGWRGTLGNLSAWEESHIQYLRKKVEETTTPRQQDDDGCRMIALGYIALIIRSVRDRGEQLPSLSFAYNNPNSDSQSPWALQLAELETPDHRPVFDEFCKGMPHLSLIREDWEKNQLEFAFAVTSNQRVRALYYLSRLDKIAFKHPESERCLPLAASRGWEEVVKDLLDLGVSVNARDTLDRLNKTGLIHSVIIGNTEQIDALLRKGASTNIEDAEKKSAWFHASSNGNSEVVQRLISIQETNLNGNAFTDFSPLGIAAVMNHAGVVTILLEDARVDPFANGTNQRSPFYLAVDAGFKDIARLFFESGRLDDALGLEELGEVLKVQERRGNHSMVKFLKDAAALRK